MGNISNITFDLKGPVCNVMLLIIYNAEMGRETRESWFILMFVVQLQVKFMVICFSFLN